MVSVIVPTIGRESLLRTIDSIKAQTYQDIEIIVVDDCSPSCPIVQGVTYVRLPENSGFHAKPRNTGIKLARAKYIAYLDDDDVYHSRHIEMLVNAIESGDYDFSYARRQYVNENGSQMQSQYFDWNPEQACSPFWLGTCDILHTKKIIHKLGGWNEDLRRYGDFELGCRLGRLPARGVAVNEVLTDCYSYNDQMSYAEDRASIDPMELTKTEVKQKWLR